LFYDNLAETKCAASPGGTEWYSIAARSPVNTVESGRERVPTADEIGRRELTLEDRVLEVIAEVAHPT
jgi:hypothetical protein